MPIEAFASRSAEQDMALLELLHRLDARGYRFVTITPASHRRVAARSARARPGSLIDIFGWNLPFDADRIPGDIRDLLHAADMLAEDGGLERSRLRISTVRETLFLHSAFPPASDAVFLGPDSYRFADLIEAELAASARKPGRIIDIGTGAGVGAIAAARHVPGAAIVMTDVNETALRLARINAAAAGVAVETIRTAGFDGITDMFDLVAINPPYIVDEGGPTYRDGGGMHGGQLSLDLAIEALPRLAPGGRLILYTGSAIVDGDDRLKTRLAEAAAKAGCAFRHREIDPDVFGEELDNPAYAEVDRVAVVAAIFTRPD